MPKSAATIVLVVFDGVEALDVAGVTSVFTRARELTASAAAVKIASPYGGDVVMNGGLVLAHTVPLAKLSGPFDTILVAGGDRIALQAAVFEQGVPRWVARASRSARRTGSVCTGAFVLAASGLLKGKRVVTHWSACDELQALCPEATVEPDSIYEMDEGICTSAGVSAGIDLALALVEIDHGGEVAARIARDMVLFLRRPGGQSQFSAAAAAQVASSDDMRALVTWIVEHPSADLSVPALAARAGMSERNFARTFRRETGVSPARFVLSARLDHAKLFLASTTWPLKRVAERAGLGSIDSLQRVFRQRMGISPSDYRERFAHMKRRSRR